MWNCANYIHVLYQYQCKGNEHHWFIENKSLAIHVFIKQIYKTWSDWIIMKICFSYYLAFLHKAYNTGPWRFNILQSDHIFLNAKSLQNHHLPDWTSFSVNACVLKVFYLLVDILESVLEKHRHLVAATPPPSPTSGEDGSTRRRSSSVMLFSSPLESSDTGKYTVWWILKYFICQMFCTEY